MEIEEVIKWNPSLMIEVELADDESFLKIKETLTRVGISTRDNTLYQSCHILHKRGRYFLVSFKELFALDGRTSNFTVEDMERRNRIALLLEDWDLLTIISDNFDDQPVSEHNDFRIISHKDKHNWKLVPKYNF
jgi:hypothetical protein